MLFSTNLHFSTLKKILSNENNHQMQLKASPKPTNDLDYIILRLKYPLIDDVANTRVLLLNWGFGVIFILCNPP